MNFRRALRRLKRALAYHEPLITVSLSRENLLHNLHAYQAAYPEQLLAPVLKSNAYGHDLRLVAEVLDRENLAFFAADSLYEARILRKSGVRSRILVIGYVRPEYIADSAIRRTDYAITDIEQLRELARLAHRSVRVHLKLDTGMHRNGILPTDLDEAIRLLQSNPHLQVAGVCSHLADADNADESFSRKQVSVWNDSLGRLEAAFPSIEYRHLTATKGMRFAASARANVLRVGMGLFGYDTSPSPAIDLLPVLEMRSVITSIREVPQGSSVGYNAAYTAMRPSRIATVPAGYYEGVERRLSNVGSFIVRDMPCPIAGRVSMNMTSIDVTDAPAAERGDTATVISRDPAAPNSVIGMARLADTTPYVILAHIPQHLRRVME